MSLINQMLKDLENRSKQPIDPNVTLSGLLTEEYTPPSQPKNKFFISIAIVLLVLILVISFFHKHNKFSFREALSKTVPTEVVAQNQHETTSISTSSTPSILTGITLQTENNVTYLRFLLNQDTYYTINTDVKKNKLIIELDHTNVVADLPAVDYLKSAIKGMEISNNTSGNLLIALTLNNNTTLQRLDLNNTSGQSTELQLDILSKNADELIQTESNESEASGTNLIKKPTTHLNLEMVYKNAVELSWNGQNDKAIQLLNSLLDKYPQYSVARQSLIDLLLKNGNISKAKKILAVGMDLDPDYIPFIEQKARFLVNEGKVNLALDLLQRTAPPIDQNPEYHAFIAALYQQQGQSVLAAKLYEQLISLQPNKGVWWMGLAIALESQGNTSEAKEAYFRANNSGGLTPELNAFIQSRISSI